MALIQHRIIKGTWSSRCTTFNNMFRKFDAICRKAGVPKCTLHDFRRSAVTNWAEHLPIQVVQQLAGHSDITTTRNYYLAIRNEDIELARTAIGAMLADTICE